MYWIHDLCWSKCWAPNQSINTWFSPTHCTSVCIVYVSPAVRCRWSSSSGRCERFSPSRLWQTPPVTPPAAGPPVSPGRSDLLPADPPTAPGRRSYCRSVHEDGDTGQLKLNQHWRDIDDSTHLNQHALLKHHFTESSACPVHWERVTWMASTLAVHSLALCRASLRARTLGRYAGIFLASITMLSSVSRLWRGLQRNKETTVTNHQLHASYCEWMRTQKKRYLVWPAQREQTIQVYYTVIYQGFCRLNLRLQDLFKTK